ncbi:MAG TPA: alpha/beta hydrolase [Thermoanaerobaculia bacterium]|nr:alpha/beta hydrolase [Thermoanaerobaculia bacterium]
MSRLGAGLLLLTLLATCPAAAQEVRFTSGDVTLAGLLRRPSGTAPHPAVVLLPGSLATAKEDVRLAAVAAAFTARGFAVLTADSRGTGGSQGDFDRASLELLAADAAAAVAMLRQRPDVRAAAVGLWGVSQGASWVGPLAAQRSTAAFLVAASGPLLSPEDFVHRFFAAKLRNEQKLDEPTIERIAAARRAVWSYFATGRGYEAASQAVEALRREPWFASSGLPPTVRPPGEPTAQPARTRTFLAQKDFDPVAAIAGLPCPALFVYGAEDTQLPVAEHAATLRAFAPRAKAGITVEIVPGVDHDLRPTSGGTDNEALLRMARWAEAQVAGSPGR